MTATTKISEKNKDFFALVYAVVKQIPYGRVTSYGAIAKFLGMARSARMVGWAMNASHGLDEAVPAHRVVNRVGVLSGKHHFGEAGEMQRRLESEGVRIEEDQIINFEEIFWDPAKELTID